MLLIKAVLFDLFDTLYLHPEPRDRVQEYIGRAERIGVGVNREAMVQALSQLETHIASRKANDHVFAELKARNSAQYYCYWSAQLLRFLGAGGDLEARGKQMNEEYVRDEDLYLDPQAITVLTELRRHGLSTGLVTNSPKLLLEVLPTLEIAQLLDNITISSVVGVEKPDPRIFRLALKQICVAPYQAVYVGDNLITDVNGANRAGMVGILLDRYDEWKQHEYACPRTRSLQELPGVLGL